jgi:excisionase family DNA binding protein
MPPKKQPLAEAVNSNVVRLSSSLAANSAILTKQQAAEYLQTTPRYIERMVSSGRLRALKPSGKLWRVRRSDLDAFLEKGASITA